MNKCTKCRWYKNPKNINCVGFDGNTKADIVFLGEAWGKDESEAMMAFVGSAGKKLDELLALINLPRESVAIMNSIRCWLPDNPKPTVIELDKCFPYTFFDIQKIKPKLVVALGDSACYQATGKSGISQHRRKLLWSDKIKCKVLITYHPAAVLYNPAVWNEIKEDFKLIPQYIDAEPFQYKNFPYEVLDTEEKVFNLIEHNLGKPFYFDSEFTSLDLFNSEIRILQFTFEDLDRIHVVEEDILKKTRNEFERVMDLCPVIGQAFDIDVKMLYTHHGLFPVYWEWDTCLAEYALEGTGGNDLDTLTKKYVPECFGYSEEVNNVGGAHKVKDKKTLFQYGANDVGVMPIIKKKQHEALIKRNLLDFYNTFLLPCNKVLTKMSLRGVLLDVPKIVEIDKIFEKRANRALIKAMALDGVKECERFFKKAFNPRSVQMVKWLLLEYYKLPVLKMTDKDNPSIGEDEMDKYSEEFKNPYCINMSAYRSFQVTRANFLSGVIPKLHNGVAHTKYSLHATTTGRPNSREPNLLNFPRDPLVRQCIISRPGLKFVYADMAQLEVRIASVVYNEPKLIEISNDFSKDIHSRITAQAFGKTYDYVYNGYKAGDPEITELRVQGKTVQFGVIYQEGASKLAYQLGITEEKAKQFIADYYNNFPDLAKNIGLTKKLIVKQGYLDNYFGFRRKWRNHKEEDHQTLREGVNFLVQSLAWNVIELCLIKIDKELDKRKLKSKLVMQVYDSIIAESPEEEIDEVASIFKEIMESVNIPYDGLNRVKLKSDPGVGDNLANVEKK